jgi:GAF domain-containing protein
MPGEKLLRRILDGAICLTGAQVSALFLLDRNRGQLCLEAVRQGEAFHSSLGTIAPDSHAEDVLRARQPLWISGPTKRTGVTSYLGLRATSCLYVPVKLGGDSVGVIGIARLPEDRALSAEVQERLATLADYAAIALQNANLYNGSQQQTRQLTTVNRIAQMIALSLDLDDVMRAVVRNIKESLHAETATLVLLDEESGESIFQIVLGNDERRQSTVRLKEGQGIVGWVTQNGQSLWVNDVSQDNRFYSGVDQAIGFRTRSILCVRLTVSNKVIGAIEAINKLDSRTPDGQGQFTTEDEELLRGAAAFITIAVENARLHAAMRETVSTQTLQDTVVTLSHSVNNPLQSLLGAAESLRSGPLDSQSLAQVTDLIDRMVRDISVVISVLRDIASPESTVCLGSIQMLDIEKDLETRLISISNPQ